MTEVRQQVQAEVILIRLACGRAESLMGGQPVPQPLSYGGLRPDRAVLQRRQHRCPLDQRLLSGGVPAPAGPLPAP